MIKVVALPSFERSVKKLSRQNKDKLAEGLEGFNSFLLSGAAPAGLGFKKINHDKYEFRIDIKLRVILKIDHDTYYLVLVGNHEEIKRYLRNFR